MIPLSQQQQQQQQHVRQRPANILETFSSFARAVTDIFSLQNSLHFTKPV